jgi:hypothetical protein
MGKALSAVVVIIIVGALIGAGAYYYFYYLESGDKDKKTPPPDTNRPPIAVFEFENGSSGRVNELLWFNANGSSDPDGEKIFRYEWDFADGTEIFTNYSRVNHSFVSAGEYDVNLTVKDKAGARDSIIKTITIRPTDYQISSSAILLSQEPLGLPSEINQTFPVEEFAVSLEINISFIGASLSGSSLESAKLDVLLINSMQMVIQNQTSETRFTQAFIKFILGPDELQYTGIYELIAKCTQGSLQLQYSIEILY